MQSQLDFASHGVKEVELIAQQVPYAPQITHDGEKTKPSAGRSTALLRAPKISIIIPALNEAENLPYVLPRVRQWAHEVILVDGWSSDHTPEVARTLHPEIIIIHQEGRGKGDALITGFKAASGDIIVMLDADGSTDPGEIPAYVGMLLSGADFAKGSRFLQGGGTADMPLYRKLGNWCFVLLVRLLFGGGYTDLCYGYNAFWKRILPQLELDGQGFEIEAMMNIRALSCGLKVTEVPSFEFKRVYGTGRLRTIPDGWRVLKTILRESFRRRKRYLRQETLAMKRSLERGLYDFNSVMVKPPRDVTGD